MKEVYLHVMDWEWEWKVFPWVQLSRSQKGMATLSAWLVPVAWEGGLMVDVNPSRISDVEERSADGLKHAIKQA